MKISPRRRAREFAVQALYQAAIGEIGVNEVAKNIREASDFGRADEALFTAIFFGAQSNKAEYMAIIRPLLAFPVIIYFWKVIVWDKVLGLGTTDPITGMIADWTGMIVTAYVGGRSIEKVARIFKR